MFARLKMVLAFAVALAAMATLAIAHDVSEPGKPKHGGQYVEYELHYGIELVASDDKLTFHITEHLEPMEMQSGPGFNAIVQSDAGTKMLPLTPEGTTLIAPLTEPIPKGARIVLTGKDKDGLALQARFVKQ